MSYLWPLNNAKHHPFKWKIASKVVIAIVGSLSKFWCTYLNRTNCINMDNLMNIIKTRSKDVGLITVSNHHSCIDDPLIWGNLPYSILTLSNDRMRWTLGASEICFSKMLRSYFFALGRVVPTVRGHGVFQPSVNYVLDKLNEGAWVHLFVEGGVNETHKKKRIKWGVARLITDCNKLPIVIPIWHCGMDDILPNKLPYIPQIKKEEIWKALSDKIQKELHNLQDDAERLHYLKHS